MSHHRLTINGRVHEVDAESDMPLLWALRDLLGLVGTKFGCGIGQCGACTVQFNGQPTRACLMTVAAAAHGAITTIEGLSSSPQGRRLQAAWLAVDVPQCGYCQGGQLLAADALLRAHPRPSEEQITVAMAGNLCRCGTYPRIRAAIHSLTGDAK